MDNVSDALILHCNETILSISNTRRDICRELEQLFQGLVCDVALQDQSINYFEGYSSSSLNRVLYTLVWASLVVLWPVTHWAIEESLSNSGLDLLIHRYGYFMKETVTRVKKNIFAFNFIGLQCSGACLLELLQ